MKIKNLNQSPAFTNETVALSGVQIHAEIRDFCIRKFINKAKQEPLQKIAEMDHVEALVGKFLFFRKERGGQTNYDEIIENIIGVLEEEITPIDEEWLNTANGKMFATKPKEKQREAVRQAVLRLDEKVQKHFGLEGYVKKLADGTVDPL